MEITAGDLLIRPWKPADIEAVHRACQDPLIQRWTSVPSPYELRHAESFITETGPEQWETGTAAPLGVFRAGTDELLGACGLASTNPVRHSAEIGYWTAPWARGRGVALAATRAVATWAFDFFGLSRLTWSAEIGNHASRLVAMRAGIQVAGEHRMIRHHPAGRREAWVGTLLPGEVTQDTPEKYASGSPVARRAALFGAAQPALEQLRPLGEDDLDAIIEGCQDPESIRWTTVPAPYNRSDAEFFVRDHAPATWARGHGAIFAIRDGRDAWAGSMALSIDSGDPGTGEVGYLVAPWARGRGYATRALRALTGWGFDALGLQRIVWRAYLGNDASRRVAEKAGFTIEGIQRSGCVQRGERRDAWVGAKLAIDPRWTSDGQSSYMS
jgi:RimJ/RimL family protein N-acetyltransferase